MCEFLGAIMTPTISEIMNTELQTLSTQNSLWDAVQLMNKHSIRHIPVVDDEKLMGLLTQRDALLYMHKSEEEQKSLLLLDIMTTGVVSIAENASIRNAALFLQKHKLGCLPVVEGKKLVGIITDTDIVSVAINLLEQMEVSDPLEDDF
jgi:CBS domain-containing membrane protein